MDVMTLNGALAAGTIVLQLLSAIVLGLLFVRTRVPEAERVLAAIRAWALPAGFLVALGGTVFSLYYSYAIGYAPCDLCWFQRVFLYPQAVLLGMAAWRRDIGASVYALALSIIGAGIAFYQHVLQITPSGALPCPAGDGPSCAQRLIFEFGYVTMPLMAFTLFLFLIVLLLAAWSRPRA